MCTQCGVVYQDSRWQWLEKPENDATGILCPACELMQNGRSNGRLIDLQSDSDKTVLTFTDGHHPKRIGHALEQAYDGDFEIHYNEDYCEDSWRR